ncbi:MAG: class I SAM-dependent methyltransferase [Candidatus Bathyarchaeota archaeon]|nr:class I SAM-dependent methyltransferase [Candidatus Bathyarchaeota archaeon A05DMB-5]MDH7557154.1 class I SAM-dependent methyltransferase [Candidatus Bathyarchaeota archaeon]
MLILDVGSGTDKLDIARGNICIDLCKHPENRPENFVCGDAHHLPFKAEIFYKICFYELIEHVESPIQCLREIYRVLKKRGILELSTPNIFHWRIIIRQIRGLPQVLSDRGYIACWSRTEMENVLLNADFSHIKFRYTTLPLVFSPHKTLDKIAKLILPSTISEKNVIVTAIKG